MTCGFCWKQVLLLKTEFHHPRSHDYKANPAPPQPTHPLPPLPTLLPILYCSIHFIHFVSGVPCSSDETKTAVRGSCAAASFCFLLFFCLIFFLYFPPGPSSNLPDSRPGHVPIFLFCFLFSRIYSFFLCFSASRHATPLVLSLSRSLSLSIPKRGRERERE